MTAGAETPASRPKARWTVNGPLPEVTKLPEPWILFVHPPWAGKARYPGYGQTVICTDGRSVWVGQWFDDFSRSGWSCCHAWRPLPPAPDLGLIWPSGESGVPLSRAK